MSMEVGHIPALTWNRLGVNHAEVADDLTLNTEVDVRPEGLPEGVTHRTLERGEAEEFLARYAPEEPPEHSVAGKQPVYHPQAFGTGLGAEFDVRLKECTPRAELLETAPGVQIKDPVLWNIEYPEESRSAQEQILHIGEGSSLTLIMVCRSGSYAGGTALISTKVLLEAGARLHLVKAQLLGDEFLYLDDTGAALRENAGLKLTQIELGAGSAYVGVQPELVGNRSGCEVKLYYLGREERLLDFNYNVVHRGQKTESRMSFDGVMDGQSRKTLRDTIDFRRGSGGSKGREEENVLVLSDDIVNKSMPIILCEEEDVEGSHGATIGRMDENVLFYLASRGVEESEAIRMMVRAKLSAVSAAIPDAALRRELAERAEEEFE